MFRRWLKIITLIKIIMVILCIFLGQGMQWLDAGSRCPDQGLTLSSSSESTSVWTTRPPGNSLILFTSLLLLSFYQRKYAHSISSNNTDMFKIQSKISLNHAYTTLYFKFFLEYLCKELHIGLQFAFFSPKVSGTSFWVCVSTFLSFL